MTSADDACLAAVYQRSGLDPNQNIVFCYQFQSGDYWQVFIIALLMFAIYSGICMLPFAKYALYAKTIHQNKSSLLTQDGREAFRFQIFDEEERQLALDRYGGMPFLSYLIYHASLSLLYLCIKLTLLCDPLGDAAENQYTSINAQFEQHGFKAFVNAECILLTYLLTHNISNVSTLTQICRMRSRYASDLKRYAMCSCVAFIWLDVIISMALLCYKWALLLLLLYELAVLIVFVLLFLATCICTVPVMLCAIIAVVTIFSIFGTENSFGKFAMGLAALCIFSAFGYLALCAVLCLIFMFVHGPHESVIYLDLHDPNHTIVLILFCMTVVLGIMSVITGICYDCKDSKEGERQHLTGGVQYFYAAHL